MTEYQPVGNLSKTREYHHRIGSSSPIPAEFGDDVPWGDTLSHDQLQAYYDEQLAGLREVLTIPPERRSMLLESGLSGVIDTFRFDLPVFAEKGIDVTTANDLLAQL